MDQPIWVASREISAAKPSSVSWIVDEYIPANTVTLLSSVSGSGKSIIALHLGLCLASGRDWLGLKCRQSSFAYWDQDNPDSWLTDNRICAIKRGLGLDLTPTSTIFRTKMRVLGVNGRVYELIAWLKSIGATVLIVDTLASVNPYPENDPNEMARAIIDNFFPMVEAGITPIILHHIGKDVTDNKGNTHRRKGVHAARGSSALMAAVGAAFNLDRTGDTRQIECVKPRYGESPILEITYDEEGYLGSEDWKITITSPSHKATGEFLTHFISEHHLENTSSRKLVEYLRNRGYTATQSTCARALGRVK